MASAIGFGFPDGARYYTGADKIGDYSAYAPEAHVWNNDLKLGQLNTQGIIEKVWGSAHNQNVYMESLNQRMKTMEDDRPSAENALAFRDIGDEIRRVRESSSGQPWADVFNAELLDFEARAEKGYVYNGGNP